MRIVGIIPARFASSRYPGKPLIDILGKTMIQRVYEQALACPELSAVYVATDDERIYDHVASFGGKVVMTLPTHESGTERCHEAVQKMEESFDAVINIQGDEPYIEVQQLEQLIELIRKPECDIATLVKRIDKAEELLNPNKVKVVMDTRNRALYFSRSTIPHLRDLHISKWLTSHDFYKHLGLYAYKTEVLREIIHLEHGVLEQSEKLEQLRWLAHGKTIHCGITKLEAFAIDTPQDLQALLETKASEGAE